MKNKLNIAVIGCGEFARSFVPLFKAHPYVDCVRVCDKIASRAEKYNGTLPRVNAWAAARFTIPGLMAHRSAEMGGVPLDIPDYGDAPADLEADK